MFRISTFPLSTLRVSSGESKFFFSVAAIAHTSELKILESEAAFITNERGSQHARRVERPPTAPVSTQSWASRELKLTTEAQRARSEHRGQGVSTEVLLSSVLPLCPPCLCG